MIPESIKDAIKTFGDADRLASRFSNPFSDHYTEAKHRETQSESVAAYTALECAIADALNAAYLKGREKEDQETRCNGWTNYATWRVNLEIWSDYDWSEDRFASVGDLARYIEDYTDDVLTQHGEIEGGLALDYARSFVRDVDWHEIAQAAADSYPDLIESDDDTEGDED